VDKADHQLNGGTGPCPGFACVHDQHDFNVHDQHHVNVDDQHLVNVDDQHLVNIVDNAGSERLVGRRADPPVTSIGGEA